MTEVCLSVFHKNVTTCVHAPCSLVSGWGDIEADVNVGGGADVAAGTDDSDGDGDGDSNDNSSGNGIGNATGDIDGDGDSQSPRHVCTWHIDICIFCTW